MGWGVGETAAMLDFEPEPAAPWTLQVNPIDRLTHSFSDVRKQLLRFLTRRVGRARAEDVLHEVWLNLRTRSDPASWREPRAVLFTTAANLATDAYRRDAREILSPESGQAEPACTRPGPELQAEAADELKNLAAALEDLPGACRDAFLFNRLEGLTHAEIADRLGVSTKTVQRYIERAMRRCLEATEP
jgi:RNA polymerase sigma-70 factor (ECF subfamily)